MTEGEEELKVELPPAAEPEITVEQLGLEPTVEVKTEAKPGAKPEVTPEEGIEKLKADLAATQAERDTLRVQKEYAENVAKKAQQETFSARGEVQDSNLHMVANAISALEQTKATLKRNLRDAQAMQDADAISDVMDAMSDIALQLAELRRGKDYIEKQPKPQPQQQITPDPVEYLANQLPPKSAAWIRAHPDQARDYESVRSAHFIAIRNHLPESDGYFAKIEELLDLAPQTRDVVIQPERQMTAPPAAPPSRGGNGTGSGPKTIRLTRDQVEAAEASGLTVQEYAKNLMALRAEGSIQ